ncbi:DUF559 domain-containing protein [Myxococcus sp. AB036A]|uniref:DUF559 domain-containing protein n=1 Tax=Myxococcus sp. AB036A TaxID=2562793 RepID=UPI0018918166|nr:DUF559 domain-containing protein [Myxococcus sp. AB036A]
MSLPQRVARLALEALGLEHNVERRIRGYYVDFLLPALDVVLEIDGDYWHQLPRVQEKNRIRDEVLKQEGLRVVHLDARQVLKAPSPKQLILEAIHGSTKP